MNIKSNEPGDLNDDVLMEVYAMLGQHQPKQVRDYYENGRGLTSKEPQKEVPLLDSNDAVRWAKQFIKTVEARGHLALPSWLDESLMISWFSNAMCAQMDIDRRQQAKVDAEREVYVLINAQTSELIAVYGKLPCKSICDRDYSLHLGRDLETIGDSDIPVAGQSSSWNCMLYKVKVDSLNRAMEQCAIEYQTDK